VVADDVEAPMRVSQRAACAALADSGVDLHRQRRKE